MSQKRVAFVLLSLVITLTVSAMTLLALEGRPIDRSAPATLSATYGSGINTLISPKSRLQLNRWKYIIIYQSGTPAADAATLAAGYRIGGRPGHWGWVAKQQPVNFHFVVDNSHNLQHMPDGNLEIGTSWLYQHTAAPNDLWPMRRYSRYPSYSNAVGVCMVGNVNRAPISHAQAACLSHLVRALQRRMGIPSSMVQFQWDLSGQATPAERRFAARFRRGLRR